MASKIWTEWLPDPIRTEVKEEEGKRFAVLVQALKDTWRQHKDAPWPQNIDPMLHRFPLFFQFLDSCQDYDLKAVQEAIEVSLEIAFAAKSDATALVRYADAVSHLLRSYKTHWKGKLKMEWRPFYEMCMQLFVEDRYLYAGEEALSNIRQSVVCLIFNCSKYFPRNAFFEVWEILKPTVSNVRNAECFIALGWLTVFLPAQELSEEAGDWNALMCEWLEMFERVSLCDYWLTHWFDIFARLAKYDTKGLIQWNAHAPRLFSAFLYCFDLPIGTATGEMKYTKLGVPRRAEAWFPTSVLPLERSAAKCIIFMLRNDTTNTVVLPHVAKMINLLEQFCHPSNGGEWTSMLATFLKHLVKQLMKVISQQDSAKETRANLCIPKEVTTSLVKHLLKMASRGQFSKNKDMRSQSCQVFRQLAYLEPHTVLPLVYERFTAAIGSPHAPATLGAATHAFALCVRPMLMHGLTLPEMDDPKEAALQAVAQAMMDVLPGLDANDHAKTGTVFRFYAAVLFSVPSLGNNHQNGKGLTLPLDVELWSEEFLSRILVLLENMEGPEARTDQSHTTETTASTGTFLGKDVVFFEWCVDGFLMKLPSALQLHAIKRVATFLLSSALPRSSQECEKVCSALVAVNKDATARHLVRPLVQALLEELPPCTSDATHEGLFTRTLTMKICWKLRLLGTALDNSGDLALEQLEAVCEIVNRSLNVESREIQDVGGACLLKSVLWGLLFDRPVFNNESMCEWILPSGVARWVAKEPENWSQPKWRQPSAKEIAAAELLTERYLEQSIVELEQLMKDAPEDDLDEFEENCNAHLNKIRGILSGAEECLVDFEMSEEMKAKLGSHPNATPLHIAGKPAIKIGKKGTREALCAMLLKLCPLLQEAEPTVLSNLLEVMEMAMNIGTRSPPDDFNHLTDPDEDSSKAEMYFIEPAIAHDYVQQEGSKCLKRRPYYQALSRVWGHYETWREVAAHQIWHSTVYPIMNTPETVPPAVGQLMGPLFKFSIHSYEEVADGAQHAIEKLFRRFPILTQLYTPLILPSLTRMALPEDISMQALLSNPKFETEILEQIESLMKTVEFDTRSMKNEDMELSAEASKDAAVKGSVMLMSTSFHAWSGIYRVPEKTARMIYTFIGARKNTDFDTQTFVTYLVWKFLSRFVSPPYIQLGMELPVVDKLRSRLCDVGKEGVLANWKFSLLANVLLLTVLPRDRRHSVDLLNHFFEVSVCSLPPLRKIGLRGIYALLQPVSLQADSSSTPLAKTVREKLKDAEFVKRFVRVLVDDHVSASDSHANGSSGSARMRAMMANGTFEEQLVNGGHVFVDRFGKWPEGETPSAISDGTFQRTHAAAIKVMAEMAPLESVVALKPSMLEFSERLRAQSDEKHEISALAEIMGGLTASGAPFQRTNGSEEASAWSSWFAPVLKESLGRCSLEFATGAFSVAVRYAAHYLLKPTADHSQFVELVQVLLSHEEKSGTGQSTAETKKLTFLENAFREMTQGFLPDAVPETYLPLYGRLLELLEGWLEIGFQSVRKLVATFTVSICAYLLTAQEAKASSAQKELATKAQVGCKCLGFESMSREAIQSIQNDKHPADPDRPSTSDDRMEVDPAAAGASEDLDMGELQSKIGIAVQFVASAMHHPQLVCFTSTLIRLLSGVFQIQELGDTQLKPLQLEAVTCFASLKYLTVQESEIGAVVEALKEGTHLSQWHARAAALVFLQVFWFHHSLVLSIDDSATLKHLVVRLLQDEKLEVRNAACSTLAGMIKGMADDEQSVLRAQFLADARRLYPSGRRKQKAAAADAIQRHACILGLKAFVMSHPYDIPAWMSEVLMAMIPAAHDKHPIKSTVTKTLGDFRTTHENESHESLRHAFDEETWESIQAVGSQASYFT